MIIIELINYTEILVVDYRHWSIIGHLRYMNVCILRKLILNVCTAENLKFYVVVANNYNCY